MVRDTPECLSVFHLYLPTFQCDIALRIILFVCLLRVSVLRVLQILAAPIGHYQTPAAEDALRTGRAL